MPETVPDGAVFFWHEADEVDPYHRLIESFFHHIVHHTSLEYSSFCHSKCIEWMGMRLVEPVAYLDEYGDLSISCDNIDLTSLDRIVHLEDLVFFSLEILPSNFFARVASSSTRLHRIIGYEW